mgnify:CR=1 FL=1
MKKVFVVYVSAGAGHQKAAEAVYEYLLKTRPDLELKLINILDYCSPLVKFLYSKGYIFLISKHQWLWHLLYKLSYFFANNPFRFLTDYKSAKRFSELLKVEKPDIVFSTHFLASSVITVYKRKKPSRTLRLITIITDYNLHPYWLGEGVDIYISACDYVKDELLRNGIAQDKIRVYGIPVKEKFYLPTDRKIVAQRLQIDPSKFTVLIITGTIGIGPIEEIVKTLADSTQLLVVCGRNKELFERLVKLNHKNVTPYPLIDYVDELMSVSDIVLTKAGGLTISESLVKGLPMIFFSNIPGLETMNAKVITAYGAGFITETITEIKEKTLFLMNNLVLKRQVARNLKALGKVETLSKIASEIVAPPPAIS